MASMGIEEKIFGMTPDQRPVTLFTLTNKRGTAVSISDFGGCVVALKTADRNGKIANIVLGYETLQDYLEDRRYFGCIVGRCANRIANARFDLNGKTHALTRNAGKHHLHGGEYGFGKRLWLAQSEETQAGPQLTLHYFSPDMEEGYPANLKARVVYTLTGSNALEIDYLAESDQPTIVNLTHHIYFNLTGSADADCLGHAVMINADSFLPIDEEFLPIGEIRPVHGTPMDFLRPQRLGGRIDNGDPQLLLAGGYDHTWALNNKSGNTSRPAASAHDPAGGRLLEVFTTQPGLHFYTGNQLGGEEKNGNGRGYRSGFCFEAQNFPDAPHHAHFPSVVLAKGEQYSHVTIYRLSVR